MHLVQVLLPLYDNEGHRLPQSAYGQVRTELTEKFGGLTAYTRAPAEGLWKDDANQTARDEIVIFEVMASELDEDWWARYRRDLEGRFRQEFIVIRVQEARLL